jgi:predicted acetyltransferase
MANSPFTLVWPAAPYLPGYAHALEHGWSPEARFEELARIEADPESFLAGKIDREAKGPPITLPDNTTVPRLPGFVLWMWDGDFCGAIGFRWQPGTTALPPYCLGHVGYSVVPWKRRRGYATQALHLLLPYARAEGLAHIELTATADNVASHRVIEANGGTLVEHFQTSQAHGGADSLRFRIVLTPSPDRL